MCRGSTGYGKRWLHLGDKQWGHTMQHDLTDAVGWAVAEGIADESKVAIMGGSYGGYAVLAGMPCLQDIESFAPHSFKLIKICLGVQICIHCSVRKVMTCLHNCATTVFHRLHACAQLAP